MRDALALGRLRLHEQEQKADHAGQKRGRQNADLRIGDEHGLGEGEVRHEDGHGEAHAAQDAGTQHMDPVNMIGQVGNLQLHRQEAEEQDADGLAQKQSEEHAEENRARDHGENIAAKEAHIGVGQREQGQHGKVHPRVQHMLQARGRGYHLTVNM